MQKKSCKTKTHTQNCNISIFHFQKKRALRAFSIFKTLKLTKKNRDKYKKEKIDHTPFYFKNKLI